MSEQYLKLSNFTVYKQIRLDPAKCQNHDNHRFDIRQAAYELARELLANGCLIVTSPQHELRSDMLVYSVVVTAGQRKGAVP